MLHKKETKSREQTTNRPHVTSYDSCHEYSMEHWIEVKKLVEGFNEEPSIVEHQVVAAGRKAKGGVA